MKDTGLLDSGLGGTEGDIKGGSDSDISFKTAEGSDEEEVIADTEEKTKKTPKKKTPKKAARVTPAVQPSVSPAVDVDLEDISQRLQDLFISSGGEMQIITLVKKNVPVAGFAPVKFQDLLVLQALLPGCAVLSSLRIVVNRDDPTTGTVSVDLDPNLSKGIRRTKEKWHIGNSKLADEIEALLDIECGKLVVEGSTPAHGRVEEDFDWPEGLPSQLNPCDPFVLGFRPRPTPLGITMYETKTIRPVNKNGKSVPGVLVTSFFFVEKFTHVNNEAGKGLRVDEASDDESTSSTPTANKRRRGAAGSSSAGRASTSGRAGPKTTGLGPGASVVEDFDFFEAKSSPSPMKTG